MKDFFKFRVKLLPLVVFPIIFFSFCNLCLEKEGGFWVSLPNIGLNLSRHTAAIWNKGDTAILLIAGGRTGNTVSNIVLGYNTLNGNYIPFPPLPSAVERAGAVVFGDSLYIFGGSTSTTPGNFSNAVYKLNLRSGNWVTKSSLAFGISDITNSTLKLNDTLALIAGGLSAGGELKSVYLFNSRSNIWIPLTNLPVSGNGIFGASMVKINDSTILFVGGKNNLQNFNHSYRGIVKTTPPYYINWVQFLDFPTPYLIYAGAWGTGRGEAFFIGGDNGLPINNALGASSKCFIYRDTLPGFDSIDIKPTPVTHTQVDGIIINPGYPHVYEIFAAGGESTGGISTSVHEKLVYSLITDIRKIDYSKPDDFKLFQNYPNPFNPITNIEFEINKSGNIVLSVYDISGREIFILINKFLSHGKYSVKLDCNNLTGGIYFYKLSANGFSDVKKLVLLK